MSQLNLSNYFKDYLKKETLFLNRSILLSNHTPTELCHRDEQINSIREILAPSVRLEKPSNLFIYGKTGTGKTVTIKFVTNELVNFCLEKNLPVKVFYLNCKLKRVADTEYRLIAQLAREFGVEIPSTGLPTDEVYKMFLSSIAGKKQLLLIILDEIDQLVEKIGDEILYNLTRINTELHESQISIIGISNNLTFANELDPRVKSSLSEEELVFPPYNAIQIQDILKQRSEKAFLKNVIKPGVIEKCAALAAREHGDARRAIELLRVAGEIAERKGLNYVDMSHIDEAEQKIERDKIYDIVTTQPKQHQIALYSILEIAKNRTETLCTSDVYDFYKNLCTQIGLKPLTTRRLLDILGEFDMLGLITTRVISKGRYGRTKEISIAIPPSSLDKVISHLKTTLDVQ